MKRGVFLRALGACGLEQSVRGLRYQLAPGGVPKATTAGGWNLNFLCTSPAMADEVAVLGGESAVLEAFLADLKPDETVWDVGANLGLYALFAARKLGAIGNVVAFEPEAKTRGLLERNAHANGMTTVRVMDCALGDADGSATIFAGADGVTTVSNLVPLGGDYPTNGSGHAIQIRRAESILQADPTLAPDVVKIDVEGAELRVLLGFGPSAWKSVRRFLIEVHPVLLPLHGATTEQVEQWLAAHGYAITSETRRRKEFHWVCDRSNRAGA